MAIGSLGLYYYNKVDGTEKLTFTVEEVDFEPTLAYLFMPFFEQDADQDIPLVPWGKEAYTAGVLPPSFQVLTPYGFLTVNLVKLTIEGDHLPEGYRAVLLNGRSLYIGDYPEICIGFPGPTPHEIEEMGKNPRCKHFRRGRLLQRQMEIGLWGPYGCVPNQFPVLAGASAEFSMDWFYDVHDDQFMDTNFLEECSSVEEEALAIVVPEEIVSGARRRKHRALYLSPRIRGYLTRFAKGYTESLAVIKRASIWLLCEDHYLTIEEMAEKAGAAKSTVSVWKKRAFDRLPDLLAIEKEHPERLLRAVRDALQDDERSGSPLQFPPEKVSEVIKIACTAPRTLHVGLSQWSVRALHEYCCGKEPMDPNGKALEAHVFPKGEPQPSVSAIYGMLKRAGLKPWLMEYYIHSSDKYEKPEYFYETVRIINQLYTNPPADTDVISIDEKTGIQSISPKYPDKPAQPAENGKKGRNRGRESEYKRHSTTTLTAGFNVQTGKVIIGRLCPTRTEQDFALALRTWIRSSEKSNLVIVLDNLNTHMSEEAVKVIASAIGYTGDLGKKDKKGILKSMKSRREFLTDPSHKIRFQFTPKHCSWLNMVELFFNTLERDLTRYISTESVEELEREIAAYIEHYNAYRAHPYRWANTGCILQR